MKKLQHKEDYASPPERAIYRDRDKAENTYMALDSYRTDDMYKALMVSGGTLPRAKKVKAMTELAGAHAARVSVWGV